MLSYWGQSHDSVAGGGGGNPLVVVKGETALEVRLEFHGAAADVPGTICELGVEEEFDAAAISCIGDRERAGLTESQRVSPVA